MYNRYIRNDNGIYSRIPEEEPHHHDSPPPPPETTEPPPQGSNLFRSLLDRFHLESIDTGDLLLLGLLFFLYREKADEELLIALGLLLIL